MNEDVKKFYELMAKDETLQAEAQTILERINAKKLPENERNDAYDSEIFALSKKKGFNFTMDEAKEFIEKLTANYGELSDSDLDQVAGGVSIPVSTIMAYGVFPDASKLFNGGTGLQTGSRW